MTDSLYNIRAAALPQGPVRDAKSLNPVLQLIQVCPHLRRALVSAPRDNRKPPFQDFPHHAGHRIGTTLQAFRPGYIRNR